MGLVDYSSGDEDSDGGPKITTRKTSDSSLPPLPRAFHDLYASTVRTAPSDDPSLHQGRQRAIPHVAGQWPSHLYIEWFPLQSDYERLGKLLASLREGLIREEFIKEDGPPLFHSFLTSDLGVPLPLHISLSRPFVLTTAQKTDFLSQLVDRIAESGVSRFDVAFDGLDWFRSPDSARAFLVLRAAVKDGSDQRNEPLVDLLNVCNGEVTAAGQPALYSRKPDVKDNGAMETSVDPASFHVSVAWTLAKNIDTWANATQKVYNTWQTEPQVDKAEPPLNMAVVSIKAKIGNIVTDIPLRKSPVPRRASATTATDAALEIVAPEVAAPEGTEAAVVETTVTDAESSTESHKRRSKRKQPDTVDANDGQTRRRNSKISLFGL